MTDKSSLLPERTNETDAERRLREAINRLGGQLIAVLDSAMSLRSAPDDAQRERHRARGHLKDFAASAMVALAMKEQGDSPDRDRIRPKTTTTTGDHR